MSNLITKPTNPERDVWPGFSSLFDNHLRPMNITYDSGNLSRLPAIDIIEKDKSYEIRAELPGVKKEDLSVEIKDGVLRLNAKTQSEQTEQKEGQVIRQERHLGEYVRSLHLGRDIDESNVSAKYTDGILTMTIAKRKELEPKKVKVKF